MGPELIFQHLILQQYVLPNENVIAVVQLVLRFYAAICKEGLRNSCCIDVLLVLCYDTVRNRLHADSEAQPGM
jgi:hypothetical protein